MIPIIIQNKRPNGNRFIMATPEEYNRLFGCPAPILPVGEMQDDTGEIIQVMMPPELRTRAGRYLQELKKAVLSRDAAPLTTEGQEAEKEYGHYLESLLKHAAYSDRRIGLINLFWLAHGKTLQDLLLSAETAEGHQDSLKYRLYTILSGFLERSQRNTFNALNPAEKRTIIFNFGKDYNWGIFNSLIEDQFALTENDVRQFKPESALGAHNTHYQMEGAAFQAILSNIEERFSEDAEKNEPAFRQLITRHTSGFRHGREHFGMGSTGMPSLYQSSILNHYLIGDEIAVSMQKKDRNIRYAVKKLGGWSQLVEEFLRIFQAIQRSEYLQHFQEFITLIPAGLNDSEIKEMFLEGRLYKYSPNLPIANNFKRVVILFADIREFTRTSEMAISARELTQRLYDVFDPLVHIVVSLGGTIDKFTGDGMMVTFGAVRSVAGANLSALRCAIAIQEAVERLRASERTSFQLGMSIHSGMVFVADFMHDNRHKETTVIGRQVNLAGRLSSTKSLWLKENETTDAAAMDAEKQKNKESMITISPSSSQAVFIDRKGNFYNVGIAASGQFLQDLKKTVDMESFSADGKQAFRFADRYLKSEVIFHYVGDARFKGFRDTTPVYGISWMRATAGN